MIPPFPGSGETDGKDHGEIDAAIAATQMMLQAADLGLGTTYVGMFEPEKLRAAFPELEGLVPIALLPLGYPAEGGPSLPPARGPQAHGGAGEIPVKRGNRGKRPCFLFLQR